MSDDVEARLDAVERALTGSGADLPSLAADAELADRVEAVEKRLDAVETRIEELDAATQAVRGYVGNVESVNEDVERRANAAVAGVEALEVRVDDLEPAGGNARRTTEGPRADERLPNGPADTSAVGDAFGENSLEQGDETPARDAIDRSGDPGDDSGDGDRGVVARLREAL